MRTDQILDVESLSTLELLGLFPRILKELQIRRIVRSRNNPVADYAEHLVADALSLTLLGRSNLGFDATDSGGLKYEIKSRRLSEENSSRLMLIRNLELGHFDTFVGVLFNEDFSVNFACTIPHAEVKTRARYNKHTNSWFFNLREQLKEVPGAADVTEALRSCQEVHKHLPERPLAESES